MTSEFYIYNGVLKRTEEPFFKINNRGFLYGDGFFESLIAFNTNIPFLNLHLHRIKRAIKAFRFNSQSIFYNPSELNRLIVYLARKNKLYKTYRIRITIYRDAGGFYRPASNDINYTIETFNIDNDKFELNKQGLKVDVYSDCIKPKSIVSEFKTLNSLHSVLAQTYAAERNLDDVLFVDSDGNITESSNSNVFLLTDNKLFTPSLEYGCVDGIMRHIIINSISNDLNIPVYEARISIHNLKSADELFLTNAVSGVKYVLSFNEKRYSKQLSERIIKTMNEKFFI